MGRIIVEQITSVDGYAARPDGSIDFMGAAGDFSGSEPEQLEMLSGADAMLFGANTYRMFVSYWPNADPEVEKISVWINEKPKHVFSSTSRLRRGAPSSPRSSSAATSSSVRAS